MQKKIPPDAFEYYFALGPGRSYRAVADHVGVSKTAVAKAAERENWQRRVAERDEQARQASEEKALETIEEKRKEHLKLLRVMRLKAIDVLQRMPLEKPMDGIKTLDRVIRLERVVFGDPSERTAVSVEDIIRREYERWMTVSGEEGDADQITDGTSDQDPAPPMPGDL